MHLLKALRFGWMLCCYDKALTTLSPSHSYWPITIMDSLTGQGTVNPLKWSNIHLYLQGFWSCHKGTCGHLWVPALDNCSICFVLETYRSFFTWGFWARLKVVQCFSKPFNVVTGRPLTFFPGLKVLNITCNTTLQI